SVGLRIGVGECHRAPARTPRAADVIAPNLAVTEVVPAHDNPRGLHNAGVRRGYDREGNQQRGEGERYAFHRKISRAALEVVERRGPPTAASIVSPPDYASENGGSGIVELSSSCRGRKKGAGAPRGFRRRFPRPATPGPLPPPRP